MQAVRAMPRNAAEAPARVLALIVAANGHVDARELSVLDELDAFRRLGVSRGRFIALAEACIEHIGEHLGAHPWLGLTELMYVHQLLSDVQDPQERLRVCRFAAAAMTADGKVSNDERLVYDHTLLHWQITPTMVSHAILNDRLHQVAGRPSRGRPASDAMGARR
jgi:tellurite resistance protein